MTPADLATWLNTRARAFELDATHLAVKLRTAEPNAETARLRIAHDKAVAVAAELRTAAQDLGIETPEAAA